MIDPHKIYDAIIVGSGVSGSFLAKDLSQAGLNCLLLEAGRSFNKHTYPKKEIDANSQLYWGGGVEFNHDTSIGFLRPKVLGGGSIVNQALLDRFDDLAFDDWRSQSGISYFTRNQMDPFYEQAEAELTIAEIPEEFRNGNAKIFQKGFEKNNYQWAPLKRAQKNCRYEDGNDCIVCLSGCPIDSKQSMPVTLLKKADSNHLDIQSQFEVHLIKNKNGLIQVHGINSEGGHQRFKTKKIILAAGALGNTKILLRSHFQKKHPALGKNFFTHPQFMVLGIFTEEIAAFKGPLQSLKSNDPNFRKDGFKLENVFAPPVAISMLLPGFGKEHMSIMKKLTHMACIEVAVRDTCPGHIKLKNNGRLKVIKKLNQEDQRRRDKGLEAIRNIFESLEARQIIEGVLPIGLHLMGGCGIGNNSKHSVVDPEFRLHGEKNIYIADSSIFPNAPGINPSLSIMALSKKASLEMIKEFR